jgi:hypothetical protein
MTVRFRWCASRRIGQGSDNESPHPRTTPDGDGYGINVVCWRRTRASPGVFLPMVRLRDEAEEYQESLARPKFFDRSKCQSRLADAVVGNLLRYSWGGSGWYQAGDYGPERYGRRISIGRSGYGRKQTSPTKAPLSASGGTTCP